MDALIRTTIERHEITLSKLDAAREEQWLMLMELKKEVGDLNKSLTECSDTIYKLINKLSDEMNHERQKLDVLETHDETELSEPVNQLAPLKAKSANIITRFLSEYPKLVASMLIGTLTILSCDFKQSEPLKIHPAKAQTQAIQDNS